MASDYVNLHTHSHYSLLTALPKIKELVQQAKAYDMDALALTDHGNMYGAIEFYKTCQGAGIKPILGAHIYIAPRSRFDKQPGVDKKRFNVVLLAKNLTGYKNLIRIVTRAHIDGFYYKPRADKELLSELSEGLICLSGTNSSEVTELLRANKMEEAAQAAKEYEDIFGKGNFYLEVNHRPTMEGHTDAMKRMVELSKQTAIPLVAAQDSYYLHPEDKLAHGTLETIQTNREMRSPSQEDLSFISPKQAQQFFRDIPDGITNTRKIADMCNVELELGVWNFPHIETTDDISHDEELRKLAYAGLAKRGIKETPEVKERIDYELDVIKQKGFSPYFIIVGDLLRHAHENGIHTTIRGSVAGSLVTYLIGITSVNPLEYKLPFERFLNPERPSAPDIDMDFADNRRDEMLAYAREKYGEEKVAQIGTFGTMAAKGAVRDVARALGHPYALGDRISKLIPMGSQGFPMTIDRALELEPELKEMYDNEDEVQEIIDLAKKVEGCARHISVHAAGVVISPTELTDFVPVQFDPKGGKLITQYDMHGVEDAGLIKFDFLGIRNLAILADAVRIVKKTRDTEVDIEHIPLDDQKTFRLLASGQTIGLFQLNGTGMTHYLMELKPSTIHDINAMVALYRPGPMESIPEYIKRKHNPALVQYLDPRLEEILDQSHGVITYQDDVMLIAIKLAGFSWLEADKLRKAMGKKIPEMMAEQKEKLLKGLAEHGMSERKIDALWKLIEPFAAYGFNKAHAASYGRVAYQTAYMKANFPAEYMTAVLSAESGDTEKVAEIITECKRMGIPVLPPDINESLGDFAVIKGATEKEDSIRFGLYTIKNLGEAISDAIIDERKQNGKYESFTDLLERITHKDLNRKSLEALIKSGAMDSFGDRGVLLANIDEALSHNKESGGRERPQNSLFGLMQDTSTIPTFKLKEAPPASTEDKLAWEKELLGLYVSGHPLDKFEEKLKAKNASIKRIKDGHENTTVIAAGIVEEIKPIITKKGDRMAFVRVADKEEALEIVVFPKVLEEFKEILLADTCVAIRGKLSKRNGETSVIADAIKRLE